MTKRTKTATGKFVNRRTGRTTMQWWATYSGKKKPKWTTGEGTWAKSR